MCVEEKRLHANCNEMLKLKEKEIKQDDPKTSSDLNVTWK